MTTNTTTPAKTTNKVSETNTRKPKPSADIVRDFRAFSAVSELIGRRADPSTIVGKKLASDIGAAGLKFKTLNSGKVSVIGRNGRSVAAGFARGRSVGLADAIVLGGFDPAAASFKRDRKTVNASHVRNGADTEPNRAPESLA